MKLNALFVPIRLLPLFIQFPWNSPSSVVKWWKILPLPGALVDSYTFENYFLTEEGLLTFSFSRARSCLGSSGLPRHEGLLGNSLPGGAMNTFSFLALLVSFRVSKGNVVLSRYRTMVPGKKSRGAGSVLSSKEGNVASERSTLCGMVSFTGAVFSVTSV